MSIGKRHFSSTDSDFDDLGYDIRSPETELLYYRGSEDQESLLYQTGQNTEEVTALSCGDRGAQDWYRVFRNLMRSLMSYTQMET